MRRPRVTLLLPLGFAVLFCACDKSESRGSGDDRNPSGEHSRRKNTQAETTERPAFSRSVRELLTSGASKLEGKQKADALSLIRNASMEECKEVLAQMPLGPDYELLLAEFSERYGKEDLPGALNWLLSMPGEAHLENAYSRLGRLGASYPGLIRSRLSSIDDEGLRSELASGFVLGLVQQKDYGELNSLLSSREEAARLGLDVESVFHTVISEMARQDDAASALAQIEQWSSKSMLPEGGSGKLALQSLGASDPAAVQAFLARHADDEALMRNTAADLVAGAAKSDPIGASKWLGSVQGPLFEQGAYGLIQTIARTEPNSAANWALAISNPELRDRAFRNIAMTSRFERDKIRRTIADSALADADKGRLLQMFQ